MTSNSRTIVPATQPEPAVKLLLEYGLSCVVLQAAVPTDDWYAICKANGELYMASRYSDLFMSVAEAKLFTRLKGGD